MKRSILATIAVFAFAASAQSADLPARPYTKAPPVVAPVATWTGCYAGLNLGGDWSKARYDNTRPNTVGFGQGLGAFNPANAQLLANDINADLNASGFVGGGQVGCNYQSGAFVIGVEADIQYTDLSGSRVFNGILNTTTYTITQSFSSKWLNTDRVRVGFASGSWLVYATGGVAVANVRYNDGFLFTANGGTTNGVPLIGSDSSTRVGWTAGIGVEWMLSGNWSVKGEYLYVDLGKSTGTYSAANGGNLAFPAAFIYTDHRLTENIVRVGFNYRFGGPVVAKY